MPLRVSVVLTVRELVPFTKNATAHSWGGTVCDGQPGVEHLQAVVSLREGETDNVHQFSALPVVQSQVVNLHDAVSGMTCRCPLSRLPPAFS